MKKHPRDPAEVPFTSNRKTFKEKIQKLKAKGVINSEIARILGCSKGLVGYHLNRSIRNSYGLRRRKWRRKNALAVKLHQFKYKNGSKRKKYGSIRPNEKFTLKSLMKKIGPTPTCYLTGATIDLDDKDAYWLNHIVPPFHGGRNTLHNCGLAIAEAAQAKGAMQHKQFIDLCRMVVNHVNQQENKAHHEAD